MDVAASEFFSDKDKTYDLNFKEDVRTATYYALLRALFFMLLYRPMIINDFILTYINFVARTTTVQTKFQVTA